MGFDLTPDYTPFEGSSVSCAWRKATSSARPPARYWGVRHASSRSVHAASDADPLGNEPLFVGGALVGRATAGAYGHVLGKSLALAYVLPAHAEVGATMDIEILGELRKATVLGESPHDPENRRLRN